MHEKMRVAQCMLLVGNLGKNLQKRESRIFVSVGKYLVANLCDG